MVGGISISEPTTMEATDIGRARDRAVGILFGEAAPRITEMFADPAMADFLDPAVVVFADDGPTQLHIMEKARIVGGMANATLIDRSEQAASTSVFESSDPRYPICAVVATGLGTAVWSIQDPREDPEWYKRSPS
jgi:hypothetical protein